MLWWGRACGSKTVGTHTQFIHVYRQACDGAPPAPLAAQVAQCRNPWLPAAQGRLLCGHYAPAMHTLGVTAGAPLLAMMLLGACLAHAHPNRRARTRRREGLQRTHGGTAARQQAAGSRTLCPPHRSRRARGIQGEERLPLRGQVGAQVIAVVCDAHQHLDLSGLARRAELETSQPELVPCTCTPSQFVARGGAASAAQICVRVPYACMPCSRGTVRVCS
jgi:hypothetical protein